MGTHPLDAAGRADDDVRALVLVLEHVALLLDGQAAEEVAHAHVLHVCGETLKFVADLQGNRGGRRVGVALRPYG